MQTLWTRVAQVRGSCRCPQCISSAQAVSRRATASAAGRMTRYWTSSTLWYSGVFAAAATFDAGIKVQRREKWDLAIAEVKQDLDKSEEEHTIQDVQIVSSNKSEFTHEYQHAVPELVNTFSSSYGPKTSIDNAEQITEDLYRDASKVNIGGGDDALGELQANLDSSVRRSKRPKWPTNTGPQLTMKHLPPQSIYSPDHYKTRAESTRWSERKLEIMQLSMDLLQLRMWYSLCVASGSQEAAQAVPAAYADNFKMAPDCLLAALTQKRKHLNKYFNKGSADKIFERPRGDLRLSNYEQDESGRFHATAHQLNKSLQALFEDGVREYKSVPAVLAKVYYNLSTSLAPPNVDTYNTLIVGLTRLSQDTRVREVIASFKQTSIRPNEVSLASILTFYTNAGDVRSFRYWLHLMRGKYGGLMMAQPNVHIGKAAAGRLIRDPEHPDKVVQLPYPTPMVFQALITGVLRFSGFDAALSICEAMSQEQWGLCMNGLRPLLKDCADRSDWSSGLAIWKQIKTLKQRSVRQERGRWVSERIGLSAFTAMLRLCSNCDKEDDFNQIMHAAVQEHGRGHKLRRALALKQRVKELEERSSILREFRDETLHDHSGSHVNFRTPWTDLAYEEKRASQRPQKPKRSSEPSASSHHEIEHGETDTRKDHPADHEPLHSTPTTDFEKVRLYTFQDESQRRASQTSSMKPHFKADLASAIDTDCDKSVQMPSHHHPTRQGKSQVHVTRPKSIDDRLPKQADSQDCDVSNLRGASELTSLQSDLMSQWEPFSRRTIDYLGGGQAQIGKTQPWLPCE